MKLVKLAGPVDLPASLERLRRWGDDLVDRWDGQVWRRALPVPWAATVVGPDTVDVVTGGRGRGPVELAEFIVQEPIGELAVVDLVVDHMNTLYPGLRPILERDPL